MRYSEAFKKSVVKEVLSSNEHKTTIANRNKVSVQSIARWLDQYEEEIISTFTKIKGEKQMSESPLLGGKEGASESEAAELRIRQLEHALRLSKLKNEAYERLIRIAEEEYKISIKKKCGTKQSKK